MGFDEVVAAYRVFGEGHGAAATQSRLRLEAHVESLRDWSPSRTVSEVRAWFEQRRAACAMAIESIPLNACRGWQLDADSGFLCHESRDFFFVQGMRVTATGMREVEQGWDQPMVTQVGFDGGILGLLRQRIHGIPMYLVEAKAEPGNYRLVQLSPTLQATFSNLRRSHGGRQPRFAEYFEEHKRRDTIVHFDQWLSEDGGRLTNKRNRAMLVEVPAEDHVEAPDGFIWISLWQIKELLHENAWVNPHLRGIIAHL